MSPRGFFTPFGSVLASLAQRYGLGTKLLEYKLHQHWGMIAGDAVAAHTRPDTIRFKKLYLFVENSVWLQHLTFLKPALIERINASAGHLVVSDIVLRVGEVHQSARQKEKGKNEEERLSVTPPAETVAEAAAYAEPVTDPDLRTRLAQVIAQALSTPQRPPERERETRPH
jgi:hypothetical protein